MRASAIGRAVGAAVWIAGAIAVGWVATVASVIAGGEGHPPLWYFVGGAVVIGSFVLAPIGAGLALAGLRVARRRGEPARRGLTVAFWVNAASLAIAIAVWIWFWWLATRR